MRKCMNWQSVNFDWNRTRAFLITAEEGSLSAAAKALKTSQPTVGRQINQLERELNLILFERKGRGLVLTPNGRELLEFARKMADAANQLALVASGKSQSVEGRVSISATEDASVFVLPQLIKKLHAIYPGIEVEIVAANETSDLLRREADMAIRGFEPTELDLITRKLAPVPANFYATRDYIDSIGSPSDIQSLCDAKFVGFDNLDMMIERLAMLGLTLTKQNFPFISDNRIVQWELVKQGLCIGIFADKAKMIEPSLAKVVPDHPPFVTDLWLVVHRELRTNRRVKAVFDFLVEELS